MFTFAEKVSPFLPPDIRLPIRMHAPSSTLPPARPTKAGSHETVLLNRVASNRGTTRTLGVWITVAAVVLACGTPAALPAATNVVQIVSQEAGVTPFIEMVTVNLANPAALTSYQFTVAPKTGAHTRPISAVYSGAALQRRGFLNLDSPVITLPVFGLYQGRLNTVTLSFVFADGTSQTNTLSIQTAAFTDAHTTFTVLTARNSEALSYDFFLLKTFGTAASPLIIDTDGELRWSGTSGNPGGSQATAFYQNGVYLGLGTSLVRLELDGATTLSHDLSGAGVTAFHHNIDFGRDGLILDVTIPWALESVNLEVDASGNVLHTWNLGMILAAAMAAGGDDPAGFIQDPTLGDWFHNNCTAYRASDNSLLVSSRENFVIALDYDSGAIKWILGDATKHWYEYPSLQKYALTLASGTLAPIGQHALSLVNDSLLLFDDGYQSLNQVPTGISRTYSAPREYTIDTTGGVATEIWNYPDNQSIYSPVCSSVYVDAPGNYLIDYATAGPYLYTDIVGLAPDGTMAFDYQYAAPVTCDTGWNAAIVHLENLVF